MFGSTEVTDDSDPVSVDIFHPTIELTKVSPPEEEPWIGYFESVDAEYTYKVENTGDCSLDVTLTDSMIAELGDLEGDVNPENGLLDPDETWTYTMGEELICEGKTMEVFTNTTIVVGEDALETQVWDMTCWNVVVFQWQPRTIGFWGNWDNHYSPQQFKVLFECVQGEWPAALADMEISDEGDVHDFLLGKPPKFKSMTVGKAQLLAEKAVAGCHVQCLRLRKVDK